MKRDGNNPKRRIAPLEQLAAEQLSVLAKTVQYVPSGHHKRKPADYGLERVSPRPTKSLCDNEKSVGKEKSNSLMEKGILCGMLSSYVIGNFPKFIWAVDEDGEVYEAKTDSSSPGRYHGYRLEEDDDFRELVLKVWAERCQQAGK